VNEQFFNQSEDTFSRNDAKFRAYMVLAHVPMQQPEDGATIRNGKPKDPFHPTNDLHMKKMRQGHRVNLAFIYRAIAAVCL